MNNRKRMEIERDLLEENISRKKKELEKLPSGMVNCFKQDNRREKYKYFCSFYEKNKEGELVKKRRYIPIAERNKAKLLAKKAVLKLEIVELEHELHAVEMYLRHCSNFEAVPKYLSKHDGFAELLDPYYRDEVKFTPAQRAWMENKYEGPVPNPEGRKFKTKYGISVRSKTERSILNTLGDKNIPFKYEERIVTADGRKIFPDFTILNVRTGEELIWEHFGDMSKHGYSIGTTVKLEDYRLLGYYPATNLITTYEADNSGVDDAWLDRIIDYFLL